MRTIVVTGTIAAALLVSAAAAIAQTPQPDPAHPQYHAKGEQAYPARWTAIAPSAAPIEDAKFPALTGYSP